MCVEKHWEAAQILIPTESHYKSTHYSDNIRFITMYIDAVRRYAERLFWDYQFMMVWEEPITMPDTSEHEMRYACHAE